MEKEKLLYQLLSNRSIPISTYLELLGTTSLKTEYAVTVLNYCHKTGDISWITNKGIIEAYNKTKNLNGIFINNNGKIEFVYDL